MKKIIQVGGQAFHLPGNNIDTDRIIPARFLKCVTFEGLGNHVFEDDREKLKGRHPFDLAENQGRTILVVDENFGSGSSREHAVPALMQWGVQAIIGLSFAEIFRGNATGNGLSCVTVTPEHHALILEHIRGDIEVDLVNMTVGYGNGLLSNCAMPQADQESLVTGTWDDIAVCLEAGERIELTALSLRYFAQAV